MAQAIKANTASTFIAQLLAPVATTKENRQFLAELREEAIRKWRIALNSYFAAKHYRDHCSSVRLVGELERRSTTVSEAFAEQQAQLDMISAVNALMLVPAPTIGALRQKQKLRGLNGGRDRWEAAIAADEARLK